MGNKSSLMLQDAEIDQISEETGFSSTQIEKLFTRFTQLDRTSCGALNKNDLLSIPELAINPLCYRLIKMFFSDCEPGDERINFKQFIKVLATFRSNSGTVNIDKVEHRNSERSHDITMQSKRQTLDSTFDGLTRSSTRADSIVNHMDGDFKHKLKFIFNIYDEDNDGRINFNDLRSTLKMMVGKFIDEAQLNKIVTKAFLEVDKDNNGFIEFGEFCRVFNRKVLDDKLRVKFFT